MWVWILIGLNIITKMHGFSSGNFPQSCDTMLPQHARPDGEFNAPQSTEPPFELSCKPGNEGDPITVFLRSIQPDTIQFNGFMLEALGSSGRPVGKFTVLDPSKSRLLSCNGSANSAVSNKNNQRNTGLQVNWTAQGADVDIIFRATFLETFDKFWVSVDAKPCPIATPTPSTQPSTELSTTISTTKSSTAQASMTTQQMDVIDPLETAVILVMIFDIVFVVLKMALSNIFIIVLHNSPFSCGHKVSQISCSLLCAAVEISAVVLLCVAESIKVTLVALVCVAMVINLIELVIVCLPIGPSHELKKICDHAVNVFSVIHLIFTKSSRNSERRRQQGKEKKLSRADVIVIAVSTIFILGNLCFAVAVAVTVGIFGC
ncbi:uncharacterized protein [Cebidichthys violaceus]|uniref:uncharacterized protein isoform X2 n=1 Tax=Cebidichthys violaceus TaxID=271503 RepID=UPI0035CC3A35